MADAITCIASPFCQHTYAAHREKLYPLRITSTMVHAELPQRDMVSSHRGFLWMGGGRPVRRGLDLVLEAFAKMPDVPLHICGHVKCDTKFASCYECELTRTPNIHCHGFVGIHTDQFQDIARHCIALVYPSCSEGMSGNVIDSLHRGLLAIVSKEASIGTGRAFEVVLAENSVQSIIQAVREVLDYPVATLEQCAREAHAYVSKRHSRDQFSTALNSALLNILRL